jgi:hypothetical protein
MHKFIFVFLFFAFSVSQAVTIHKIKDSCSLEKKNGCVDLESAKCELLGLEDSSMDALYYIENTNFDFVEVFDKNKCVVKTVTLECRTFERDCDDEIKRKIFKKKRTKTNKK